MSPILKYKIYGVYFICCVNNYLDIIREQLNEIVISGLYNDTSKLYLFITLFDESNLNLKKLLEDFDIENKFILITTPENLYEKYAIQNYKKYIPYSDDEYYLYYFHTKGVSKDKICNIFSNRRKILNFFTLKKYNLSIKLLESYDAVGCVFYKYPKPHFSGNFWWSKGSHLNKIDDKISSGYLAPEMYICSVSDGKYVSLNNYVNERNLEDFIYLNDNDILQNINDIPLINEWAIELIKFC
jgi:hypothetical protein